MGNLAAKHSHRVRIIADQYVADFRPNSNKGFTLAELVVAMTLIVIVMGAVYTSFSVAIQTWRGGETNYKTYEDARLVMSLISRELQAIPSSTIHLFNGGQDSVEFYTLAPPLNEARGKGERVLWVRYRLMSGRRATGTTLLREEAIVTGPLPAPRRKGQPINMARIKKSGTKRFEIATGIKRFQLGYCWTPRIKLSRTQEPERVDTFIENRVKAALPHGVQITLIVHDPSAPYEESTFTNMVAFRGVTSRLPERLVEESRRLYR